MNKKFTRNTTNPLIPQGAKIAPEDEFRTKILNRAYRMGCMTEVRAIFDKYDNLLRYCTNEMERKNIQYLGVCEISKYMDCTSLTINGEVIYDNEAKEEDK